MTTNTLIRRNEAGFTIIELMVVAMILALLGAIIMLSVTQFQSEANGSVDAADAKSCETAGVASASTNHSVATDTFAPGC